MQKHMPTPTPRQGVAGSRQLTKPPAFSSKNDPREKG